MLGKYLFGGGPVVKRKFKSDINKRTEETVRDIFESLGELISKQYAEQTEDQTDEQTDGETVE
jgi:hypothetical protein